MDTFPLGGISKSLLALFHQIEEQYDIDFLLMKKEGIFVPLIPESVNVITDVIEQEFRDPHPKNVIKNLFAMKFSWWVSWCGYSMRCSLARIVGGLPKMVCTMDEYIGKHSRPINKHYDAAIAYQGGRCIYYLVENVDADVKIGYVHNDYSASEVDFRMKSSDEKYYPKLDRIVTISSECIASLYCEFPNLKNKCVVVENICSPKMINTMAATGRSFDDGYKGIRLITMGRLDINQKGIDYAIAACRILKERGLDFKWYFLGDGIERPLVELLIREAEVVDTFILLGAKINPYSYIKEADIYVQPSRFEGKSVALDEVKALAKPIVVTNFTTVLDQFVDKTTALVAEMDPIDIANKIEKLIENIELRDLLVRNLQKEKVGNEEQAEFFKTLLEVKRI